MHFQPKLRFAVMSDLHYSSEYPFVRDRFQKALKTIYADCEKSGYPRLDALYINGDFTNRGKREEMEQLAEDCRQFVRPETKLVITMANHDLHYVADYRAAMADFQAVFQMPFDRHEVIGGYHFISLSATIDQGPWHDSFDAQKRDFLRRALENARQDGGNRPIFVFQHVGMTGTVQGGAYGHAELAEILSDYPQVIDFSGHSHFPVNHPGELHRGDFVSVSSGSLLDIVTASPFLSHGKEKECMTDASCAHMLVVEVNESADVRIRRLDVTAGEFFENDSDIVWSETENRLCITFGETGEKTPYFTETAAVQAALKDDVAELSFPRAHCDGARVAAYRIWTLDCHDNVIAQKEIVSDYRCWHQAETVCAEIPCSADTVVVSVCALGFDGKQSASLRAEVK